MKKSHIIIVSFFIIIIISLLVSFMLGRSIFLLKNIDIIKDFEISNDKILEYLEIYPLRPIWNYNTKSLENKLKNFYFLKEFSVKKKFPNVLIITLKIKKPIARVVNKSGKLYVVDNTGIIFREADRRDNTLPVIFFEKRTIIKPGIILEGLYKYFIEKINYLFNSHRELFDSISQIEVKSNKKNNLDYMFIYKTYSYQVYLKNFLNVDAIRRGLSCVKYMEKENYPYDSNIVYTQNGFVIK